MAEIKVTMTGDEAKVWESLQKVIAQQDKLGEGAKKN
jgi:hypothetical protein